MVSGYSLLVFGSITVGVSWLIGIACLYQKYKPDQKTCTVADFLQHHAQEVHLPAQNTTKTDPNRPTADGSPGVGNLNRTAVA